MPRYYRRVVAGSVQHLISRFVNHQFIFDLPGARAEYLARAAHSFARCDWTPLGYALMSSHVHWLAVAGRDSSDRLMRSLHGGFSGWLNRSTGRLGPVFADRHRNVECEGQTALVMLAYIHNNPVRARVVLASEASTWTSHRAYLGLDTAPVWLDVELGLHLCGLAPTAEGRAAFHDFVMQRAGEPRRPELAATNLRHARREARKVAALPVELASPRLAHETEQPLRPHQCIDRIVPPTSPVRLRWNGSPLDVLRAVARVSGVSEAELRSRSRARHLSTTRRQALLVWVHGLSRPAIEMAQALGIASTTASDHIGKSSLHDRERAVRLAEILGLRPYELHRSSNEGTKNEIP